MPATKKFEFEKTDKIILCVDASGSMEDTDGNSTTRWQDAFADVEAYVKAAGSWNSDGITVIIYSNGVEVFPNIKTVSQIDGILTKHKPHGRTNTHLAIGEAWNEHASDGKTSTFCVVMTDGHPSDPEAFEDVLTRIGAKLGDSKEFELAFVTIGGDSTELHAEITDVINTLAKKGLAEHYISIHDNDDIDLNKVLDDALVA